MKSILIAAIVAFTGLIQAGAQYKWEIVSEGFDYQALSVDYINRDTGWLAGRKGLFKTTDGAETWELVNNIPLQEINYWNDTLGWALEIWDNPFGPSFVDSIYKTIDGGITWIPLDVGQGANELLIIDDLTVFAIGENILKTVDGGYSWDRITPPQEGESYNACFAKADTGVATGISYGKIYRTFDGGETWDEKPYVLNGINNVTFIDGLTAYFTANDPANDYWIRDLYKTTDAFDSWDKISGSDKHISGFGFFGIDTIIAVAHEGHDFTLNSPHIIKSYDGGFTWTKTHQSEMPFAGTLYVVDNTAYIHGGGGTSGTSTLIKSTDQGNHWFYLNKAFSFHGIHFMNREKGFILGGTHVFHIGFFGYLFITRDGGQTWDLVSSDNLPSPPNPSWPTIHFLNDSVGFISGEEEGILLTSIDGGETWKDLNPGIYTVRFHSLNDSISWQIFSGPRADGWFDLQVKRTLNGGSSWDTVHGYTCYYSDSVLNAVGAINKDTAYGVGEGGMIMQFTEKDARGIESGTSLPLNSIYFIDERNGLITGGYRNNSDFLPAMLLTDDGGEHWKAGPDLPYLINDLHFPDGTHGFAVGEDGDGMGVILETADSGLNWEVVIDSLSARLNALHFTENFGWAVGENGLILRTGYSSTRVEHEFFVKEIDENPFLNYPNPFQTETIISYQLPETNEVQLSIYDLSGRKIATLIDESQAAGRHEIEWDSNGMNPGIYICELNTGLSREVIKMVLMK